VKGRRAPGTLDQRFESTYLYGAVRPATGDSFALVLPWVNATLMDMFLVELSKRVAPGAHAVLVLDQAGWHGAKALDVPANITLVPLPPYAPQLNPVERVWLYLREAYLSLRVFEDYEAVVDGCCDAWNRLAADKARVQSLTSYPWIKRISS